MGFAPVRGCGGPVVIEVGRPANDPPHEVFASMTVPDDKCGAIDSAMALRALALLDLPGTGSRAFVVCTLPVAWRGLGVARV